jgi:hypothetical protein
VGGDPESMGDMNMWNFLILTAAAAIFVWLGLMESGAEVWVF